MVNEEEVIDVEYNDVSEKEDIQPEEEIVSAVPEEEPVPDLKNESNVNINVEKMLNAGLKISNEEALEILKLITEYRQYKVTDVYSRLPKQLKKMVDSYISTTNNVRGQKGIVSKNNAARALLNMFIDKLGFNDELSKLQNEIHEEVDKTSQEIRDLLNDAYQKAFDNLDQIRQEDPERAKKIEDVRDGFAMADSFDELIINYLKSAKPRDIKRYKQHYNSATEEFMAHVYSQSIKVRFPNIDRLYSYMFRNKQYSSYGTDVIKTFVVALCKLCISHDVSDLKNLAMVYRTIGNVYQFGLTPQQKDMHSNKITTVLDYISSILDQNDKKKGK